MVLIKWILLHQTVLFWLMIASIFFVLYWTGKNIDEEVDVICKKDLGIGFALNSSDFVVMPNAIKEIINDFGMVIKKINKLSGFALLASVAASVVSAII